MKLAKFLLTPPIVAISVFLSVTLGAQAAVYVKADATGANNGTSWTDATTIADAIGKADASLAKASSMVILCS